MPSVKITIETIDEDGNLQRTERSGDEAHVVLHWLLVSHDSELKGGEFWTVLNLLDYMETGSDISEFQDLECRLYDTVKAIVALHKKMFP